MPACLPRGWGWGLGRLGSPRRDRGPAQAWGKELLFAGLGSGHLESSLVLRRAVPPPLPQLALLHLDGVGGAAGCRGAQQPQEHARPDLGEGPDLKLCS